MALTNKIQLSWLKSFFEAWLFKQRANACKVAPRPYTFNSEPSNLNPFPFFFLNRCTPLKFVRSLAPSN